MMEAFGDLVFGDREKLEDCLSDLLGSNKNDEKGFASDILDHLIEIDSSDYQLEYISSFLGEITPKVEVLVDNIKKWQRGERIIISHSTILKEEKKPNSSPFFCSLNENARVLKNSRKSSKSKKNDALLESSVDSNYKYHHSRKFGKSVKCKKEDVVPTASVTSKQKATSQVSSQKLKGNKNDEKSVLSTESVKANMQKDKNVEKSKNKRKPRGKAKVICGCFGTYHRPLTNCRYCGRISCIKEGYDFCPFCGYLVEEKKPEQDDNILVEATQHLQRLLNYDKENQRRTKVFDDQTDYYSNTSNVWLNEEEQEEAHARLLEKNCELHERKNPILNNFF